MKTNLTETAKRIYYVVSSEGAFTAHYRPKNPKTGKPWQASREITNGKNVHVLGNWNTKEVAVRDGLRPEDWSEGERWTAVGNAYKTEADALAAIAAEKERE